METQKDVISIIVPIYNVEKYIRKCIDSLINQSYRKLQIILVDDESPDLSGKICDDYAKIDDRITVIHQKNAGISGARNAGLDIATGEFIAFVDPDDYIASNMYEYLHKALIEKEADISICDYLEFREEEDRQIDSPRAYENIEQKEILSKKDKMEYMFLHKSVNSVLAWNKLCRKTLWENIRFSLVRAHEDEATMYQILYNAEKYVYLNEKMYYYIKRKGSITTVPFSEKRLLRLEALLGRMQFYIEKKEWAYFRETLFAYKTDLLELTGTIMKLPEYDLSLLDDYKKKYNNYCFAYLSKCQMSLKKAIPYLWYALFPKSYYKRFSQKYKKSSC